MQLVQLSAAHLGQLGGQSAVTGAIQQASGTSSLAWLLVALPLLGAAILLLGGRRTNRFGPALATGLSWATFAVGAVIFLAMLGRSDGQRAQSLHLFSWVPAGSFKVDAGMLVDPLSMAFVMLVTFVGSLILVYSLGYMEHDPDKRRFFAYLNFFVASMLLLVLADSYLLLYVGWEGVGLASYLLIGFWNQSPANAAAANKAFVANRIGDFGLSVAIMLMFVTFGTVSFAGVNAGVSGANKASLTAIGLLLLLGACGKSAQFPLQSWLGDAMAGPTPVSALIHAATMVAAGVYMLFRVQMSLGFENFHELQASVVIAWTGGITALVSALMATQQDDIKRVLAYSTLSQLGYMVMAVGLVAGEAGMFHLFTHAWFKALLFLGAGAVIHACHHEQDIWKMGGLLKKMPITGLAFAAGCLALIAVPGTSGFFSKELILDAAHESSTPLFWVAAVVAVLTPFYMTRLFVVALLGQSRSDRAGHAHEVGPLMWLPLVLLAVLALISGYGVVHQLAPAVPEHAGEFHLNPVAIVSMVALAIGVLAGLAVYAGKDSEPVQIPLLRNRFYIDDFYDKGLVGYVQGLGALFIHFFDEFLISGLCVGGMARVAENSGNLLRKVQSGSLQGYAFAFGFGVILVIYFTVFH